MKRELIVFLCLTCFLYAGAAKAENSSDWGKLFQNMATSVNTNNTATDTDELTQLKKEYSEWNTKISGSENKVQNSFAKLVTDISPKSEAAKINNKIDNINNSNNLSAVDKSAQAAQIIYDYSVNLQNNQNSLTKLLSNATAEKRNDITSSLNSLTSSTSDYASSLSQGSNLLKKIVANPKLALNMAGEYTELGKRLKTANTTLNSLNNIANTLGNLLNSK